MSSSRILGTFAAARLLSPPIPTRPDIRRRERRSQGLRHVRYITFQLAEVAGQPWGKAIATALEFGGNRREFKGYQGNIDLQIQTSHVIFSRIRISNKLRCENMQLSRRRFFDMIGGIATCVVVWKNSALLPIDVSQDARIVVVDGWILDARDIGIRENDYRRGQV